MGLVRQGSAQALVRRFGQSPFASNGGPLRSARASRLRCAARSAPAETTIETPRSKNRGAHAYLPPTDRITGIRLGRRSCRAARGRSPCQLGPSIPAPRFQCGAVRGRHYSMSRRPKDPGPRRAIGDHTAVLTTAESQGGRGAVCDVRLAGQHPSRLRQRIVAIPLGAGASRV